MGKAASPMRITLLAGALCVAACGASETVPAQSPSTTSSTVSVAPPDSAPPSTTTHERAATAPPAVASGYGGASTARGPAAATPDHEETPHVTLRASNAIESPRLPVAHAELNNGDTRTALTAADQGNTRGELRITAAIRKAVVGDSSLSFTAKNVKIITTGTRVTLRGDVQSVYERDTIEAEARRAERVTDVDNQLEVK
jgi:hyperosmotically inducible protein